MEQAYHLHSANALATTITSLHAPERFGVLHFNVVVLITHLAGIQCLFYNSQILLMH